MTNDLQYFEHFWLLSAPITHLSAESSVSSACDVASMASSFPRCGLAGFGVPAWTEEHKEQCENSNAYRERILPDNMTDREVSLLTILLLR